MALHTIPHIHTEETLKKAQGKLLVNINIWAKGMSICSRNL